MYFPSLSEFASATTHGNLIPVYREILADMETPVSAFKKIDDGHTSFLLESIEGGEKWARYSFLGSGPAKVFRCQGVRYEVLNGDRVIHSGESSDPLARLKEFMAPYRPVSVPGLPRFSGGAVGYLGYDMVRFIERLPDENPREIGAYDAAFLLTEELLIFDNMRQKIKVVCNVHLQPEEDPVAAYGRGIKAIDGLIARLRSPLPPHTAPGAAIPIAFESNFSQADFKAAVVRGKEYIRAGDIFQVVLSQRFSGQLCADPFDIYRALRTINPSPYMFFLRFGETLVVGASPEVLVRKEGTRVEVRPIAGTRPRGATSEEDGRLEEELLADPKERAEHIMLVDLGRNDIGRVALPGSVEVSELMVVERYSHVMHIVSNVRGELPPERDAFDVFRATFPAGTLSGSPKIRAMEIIDELEPCRREIYGGAVGYFSFSGNMDMAIAIRTLIIDGDRIFLQAGAGIVADSDPAAEYQETISKAMGVQRAIEMAQRGLD
ncbi:anthranilate synthase, component I [Desulfuromonas soudanensis]|uniref:Anthranilate synthase component 1 n=1 Tax=Desulfuromonas soudanensis TaxID=1603606 RepID=A0A0M4DK22_9BACT|nr:anthranilate synthase component I [Desulfuromonas soudanensis]ALC17557.1 anthranilate synthase, component I [Desulfuromonas soudanensis]